MDGRRWGAARPTGKPRASPPPALRHLGLSAARCRPRPLSWWGALGTWSPRAMAPLPALTASTPLSTHVPSRHPSGFSGLLTRPFLLGERTLKGRPPPGAEPSAAPASRPVGSGTWDRGGQRAESAPSLRPWSSRRPSSAAACGATTPGPVLLRVRGHSRSRTQVRRPLLPAAGEPRPWRPSGLFPSRRRGGRRGEEGPGGSTSPHLPRAGSTLVTH